MEQKGLKNLVPPELLVFLKHLELGDEHLKSYLTKEEYDELLSLESLDPQITTQLEADKAELAGNVTMIMNSFFTATVGLWFGLSGFLGKKLLSLPLSIAVLTFATAGGALIGFFSYKYTRRSGEANIRKSKLQALQMDIMNLLIEDRLKEIGEKTRELKADLQKLKVTKKFTFETPQETQKWMEDLDTVLENNFVSYKGGVPYRVFEKKIQESRNELKKRLVPSDGEEERRKNRLPFFIHKIIHPRGEDRIPRSSWLRANQKNFAMSFIPTIFGTLGSIFVYFSSAPTLAKEFQHYEIYKILINPYTIKIELITSIIITMYFTATSLYSNYKSFIRSRKYDENEEILIKKKNQLHKLDDELLKTKEAHTHLTRLTTIFDDLQQLTKV